MKSQQIIVITVLGAVILISGLFVALPSNISSTTTPPVSTYTPQIPTEDINLDGNLTSLSALAPSTEIINLNSPALSPLSSSMYLLQLREGGQMLIYNSSNAQVFVGGYNINFTVIVTAYRDGTNYTYPSSHPMIFGSQFCNANASLGPTGCSMMSSFQVQPSIPQITNFTLADGARGYAYQNYVTWWDNGVHYTIISAGFSISSEIQIAQSMEPVSSVVSEASTTTTS